jgi:hypothetical protein
MGKDLKIVPVDFRLIIPNELPSPIEDSYKLFHLNKFFFGFTFLFALGVKKLDSIHEHIATFLVRNWVVIIHLDQPQYLFGQICHNMTGDDAAVKELNKKLFAVVGLEKIFLALLDDSLSIYNF